MDNYIVETLEYTLENESGRLVTTITGSVSKSPPAGTSSMKDIGNGIWVPAAVASILDSDPRPYAEKLATLIREVAKGARGY